MQQALCGTHNIKWPNFKWTPKREEITCPFCIKEWEIYEALLAGKKVQEFHGGWD